MKVAVENSLYIYLPFFGGGGGSVINNRKYIVQWTIAHCIMYNVSRVCTLYNV